MEPPKPEDKLEILRRTGSPDDSEIEEYEKLLSQRFAKDPDAAPQAVPQTLGTSQQDDRSRLRELYRKFTKRRTP